MRLIVTYVMAVVLAFTAGMAWQARRWAQKAPDIELVNTIGESDHGLGKWKPVVLPQKNGKKGQVLDNCPNGKCSWIDPPSNSKDCGSADNPCSDYETAMKKALSEKKKSKGNKNCRTEYTRSKYFREAGLNLGSSVVWAYQVCSD